MLVVVAARNWHRREFFELEMITRSRDGMPHPQTVFQLSSPLPAIEYVK